jgi:hypothetical protein
MRIIEKEERNKDLKSGKDSSNQLAKARSVHSLSASLVAMCTVMLRHEIVWQKKTYTVEGVSVDGRGVIGLKVLVQPDDSGWRALDIGEMSGISRGMVCGVNTNQLSEQPTLIGRRMHGSLLLRLVWALKHLLIHHLLRLLPGVAAEGDLTLRLPHCREAKAGLEPDHAVTRLAVVETRGSEDWCRTEWLGI